MSDTIKRKFFDSEWIDEILEDATAFMKVYKECPGVEHLEFQTTIPDPQGTYEVSIIRLKDENWKDINEFHVMIEDDETHEYDSYTVSFDIYMQDYEIEYTGSGIFGRR